MPALGLGLGLALDSGAGNPDGLSLDLQFATDKSLTARKGPTPTFTRASTATFVGSNGLIQSAAINQARFDHDPVTLASKGLLIEESRTNNVTRSQEMNLWSGAGGSTRAVSTENSPDGITKATLASGGASSFGDIVARSLSSLTSVISTQYTVSCFVKKINYRYVCVDYSPIRLGGVLVPFFDLDTLVFNANGSTVTGSITSYPNGWYRLTVSGAAVRLETANVDIILCSAIGTAGSSRAGEQIYLWGAQLEAGAFPTSYIPTTTASVVRSVDVCSITGSDFTGMYNAIEGTFLTASSQPIVTAANANVYAADIGSDVFRFNLIHSRSFGFAQVGGITQFLVDMTNPTSNQLAKFAFAYKLNDYGFYFNGTQGTSASNGTVPTVDRIFIGSKGHNSTEYLNGHISAFKFFKKRLSNAKLQTLTT